MIFWRLAVGLILVALALWVIIGEQITGASADATINAKLVTLRAPIAGTLSIPARPIGGAVSRGEIIARLEDNRADSMRLNDLSMEVRLAEAAVARLTVQRDETASMIKMLETRFGTFRSARIAEIETRLSFARERLDLLVSGDLPAVFDIAPPEDAGVERTGTPEATGLRDLWINAASERIAVLENELQAAQAGVFLGDGYNDAPNAEQRAIELRSEIAALEAQLTEAGTRLETIRERMADERQTVALTRGAEIAAPVNGRYWEELASNLEEMQRGDPIARVLDCDSTFVTLSLTESVYNTLSIGNSAVFRPNGGTKNFDATVLRLAGSGAGEIYGESRCRAQRAASSALRRGDCGTRTQCRPRTWLRDWPHRTSFLRPPTARLVAWHFQQMIYVGETASSFIDLLLVAGLALLFPLIGKIRKERSTGRYSCLFRSSWPSDTSGGA